MNTVRKSLLSFVTLAAFLLCAPQRPACRQKTRHDVSAGSLTPSMPFTRQLTDTDGTVAKQIMSVVNCTMRGSVAGVSSIGGGMNTNTAGTQNATGTNTTTTTTRQA
jgi:hypothetical protein